MSPRKKLVTDRKVVAAYDAVSTLLLCDDLQTFFDTASIAVLVASKRSLKSELQERGVL